MSLPVVTLTGLPGSGKTTTGRRVAMELGLEFHSAGEMFRRDATERHVDLDAFSRLAEQDESIDRGLDARMLALAGAGRLLEGRITGALCRRKRLPLVYLVLTAREDVRVERMARRDGLDSVETRRRLRERETSERDRYQRYYGIDLARERADLAVDSSDLSVEDAADRFVGFLKRWPPGTSA